MAKHAAAAAGAIQRSQQSSLKVRIKSDDSPVTQVDERSEQLIRSTILDQFSQDGFLGEESGEAASANGRRWIVDPLDGTRAYIRGLPTYSCLVALEQDGRVVVGVMYLPALQELYWATAGGGAFCNGETIRVSDCSRLQEANGTGLGHLQHRGTPMGDRLLDLLCDLGYVFGFMDGYSYACVASGRLDLCVNLMDKPWDCAAASVIVREAGGRFSDASGVESIYNGSVVASNGYLQGALLDALASG